jgi:DNA-binding response OmpR family regulator
MSPTSAHIGKIWRYTIATRALELVAQHDPARFTLMPGVSGLEVCRALKSDPATAPISILLLSARANEVDRVVAFELGADDYVTKPFSPRELILRIRAILRRKTGVMNTASSLRAGDIVVDRERHQVALFQSVDTLRRSSTMPLSRPGDRSGSWPSVQDGPTNG